MLGRTQKGSSTYLVYSLGDEASGIDHISVSMINSNRSKSAFAPIQLESLNGVYSSILYDVTGMIPIGDFAAKNMSQDVFRKAVIGLLDAIEAMEEYMIEENQVLLTTDCVFINPVKYQVGLLCVPVLEIEPVGSVFELVHSFVERCSVIVKPNEHSYFNSVWNVVREEGGFSIANVRSVLAEEKTADSSSYQQTVSPGQLKEIPGVQTVDPSIGALKDANKGNAAANIAEGDADKKQGLIGKLFGKKDVEKPSGWIGLAGLRKGKNNDSQESDMAQKVVAGTSCPSSSIPQQPIVPPAEQKKHHVVYLIRISNGERIPINKNTFFMGRDERVVDYCLHGNMAVGRRHASIIINPDECEIIDHRSVNHTYVSGVKLEEGARVPLTNGIRFRLANEEFEFHEEF